MSAASPTYDLVLLLDPQAESSTREKIVDDVRAMVAADGEIVHQDSWGERALAYPIEKKKSAEYHLLQFRAGSAKLLEELGRSLRITDGVVRYRVIKLRAGVGEPPQMPSAEPTREEPHAAPAAPEAEEPEAPGEDVAAGEPAATSEPGPEAEAEPGPEAEPAAVEPTEA